MIGEEKVKMEKELNDQLFNARRTFIEDYQKLPRGKDIKVVDRHVGDSD